MPPLPSQFLSRILFVLSISMVPTLDARIGETPIQFVDRYGAPKERNRAARASGGARMRESAASPARNQSSNSWRVGRERPASFAWGRLPEG